MLEVLPGGRAPKGSEPKRILTFFASSLKDNQLKRPTLVRIMRLIAGLV